MWEVKHVREKMYSLRTSLYKSILMREFSRWSKWDLQMTADLRLGLKWDFVVVGTEIQEWLISLHWRNRWSCDWRIEGALGDPAVFTLPRLAIASRFFSAQKPAQLFYHLSSLIYHCLTNYMNYHGIISYSEGLSKKELVSQLRCKIYGNNYYE